MNAFFASPENQKRVLECLAEMLRANVAMLKICQFETFNSLQLMDAEFDQAGVTRGYAKRAGEIITEIKANEPHSERTPQSHRARIPIGYPDGQED